MEIHLFSKCIRELILENDRVDVPYLGTFTAEMMPASYSDRQTTIHPPYRKMSFQKSEVSLEDGRLLLDKIRQESNVSLDQAGVELGWCLSRLCSELEGSKRCKLPGLGMMRANARNEFFFVPDDELDIWSDGIGFEPIAIKAPKEEMSGQAGHDEPQQAVAETGAGRLGGEATVHPVQPRLTRNDAGFASKTQRPAEESEHWRRKPLWIVLIVLGALLLLFVAASYLFTDQMSPILDRLLYSKEELELLRGGRP